MSVWRPICVFCLDARLPAAVGGRVPGEATSPPELCAVKKDPIPDAHTLGTRTQELTVAGYPRPVRFGQRGVYLRRFAAFIGSRCFARAKSFLRTAPAPGTCTALAVYPSTCKVSGKTSKPIAALINARPQ